MDPALEQAETTVAARSRVVVVAWKDIRNPAAGGAELLLHEVSKRWVQSGCSVVHLVPGFPGAPAAETVDGVRIERVGRGILAFPRLAGVYRRLHRDAADVLIDAFNCAGSFAVLLRGPRRRALLVHHVQDRMWFHQTVFPGVPRWLMSVLAPAGYLLEKIQLLLLARWFRGTVLTISASTRRELLRYGFAPARVRIFRVGIALAPLARIVDSLEKEPVFTVLLVGPRRSKRPIETLKAFAFLHARHPEAVLWVAGWGTEDARLAAWARRHGVDGIRIWGRVDEARKAELMQRAHVLCTSPVKEGWGLVVTEANAMGTPAVGYDVPVLREALAAGEGRVAAPRPDALAEELEAVYRIWTEDRDAYNAWRRRALASARAYRFDATCADIRSALEGEPGAGPD